jgi:hypothetical protein
LRIIGVWHCDETGSQFARTSSGKSRLSLLCWVLWFLVRPPGSSLEERRDDVWLRARQTRDGICRKYRRWPAEIEDSHMAHGDGGPSCRSRVVGVVTCNLKQSKKKPRARSAKLQVDGSRTGNMGVMGGTWVPASGRPPTANSAPSSAIGGTLRPAQGMGRFCASLRGVRPRPGSATLRLCLPCPGYSSRTAPGTALPQSRLACHLSSANPSLALFLSLSSLPRKDLTTKPRPLRYGCHDKYPLRRQRVGKWRRRLLLGGTVDNNQSINHPARISSFDQPNK